MGKLKLDVQSKTNTEVSRIRQKRQREDERSKPRLENCKTRRSTVILVCIRHSDRFVRVLLNLSSSSAAGIGCGPHLSWWCQDDISQAGIICLICAWRPLVPHHIFCLRSSTPLQQNPAHRVPIQSCTLIPLALKINNAHSISSSCCLPLSFIPVPYNVNLHQFSHLIHGPPENDLCSLHSLDQTISYSFLSKTFRCFWI